MNDHYYTGYNCWTEFSSNETWRLDVLAAGAFIYHEGKPIRLPRQWHVALKEQ